MDEKNILCIASVCEDGKRREAEIYEDGTFKTADGAYLRLPEKEFQMAKALHRRSLRTKWLMAAATDVESVRLNSLPPSEYKEYLGSYREEDFLLPGEVMQSAEAHKEQDKPLRKKGLFGRKRRDKKKKGKEVSIEENVEEDSGISGVVAKVLDDEAAESATEEHPVDSEHPGAEPAPDETTKNEAEVNVNPPKKSKAPFILVIIALCAIAIGAGLMYMRSGVELLAPSPTPAATAEPTPTPEPTPEPTPAPPVRPQITLTINTTEGTEVTGSTDVEVSEDTVPPDTTATPEPDGTPNPTNSNNDQGGMNHVG